MISSRANLFFFFFYFMLCTKTTYNIMNNKKIHFPPSFAMRQENEEEHFSRHIKKKKKDFSSVFLVVFPPKKMDYLFFLFPYVFVSLLFLVSFPLPAFLFVDSIGCFSLQKLFAHEFMIRFLSRYTHIYSMLLRRLMLML